MSEVPALYRHRAAWFSISWERQAAIQLSIAQGYRNRPNEKRIRREAVISALTIISKRARRMSTRHQAKQLLKYLEGVDV